MEYAIKVHTGVQENKGNTLLGRVFYIVKRFPVWKNIQLGKSFDVKKGNVTCPEKVQGRFHIIQLGKVSQL